MAKSNVLATGRIRNIKRVRGNRGREADTSFSSIQSELMSKTLELIQLKDAMGNAYRVLNALKKEIDR
ncbi:MAG: hypothetical protein ACO30M_10660, partial [Candidatus Kapaibacteriota bacterium]